MPLVTKLGALKIDLSQEKYDLPAEYPGVRTHSGVAVVANPLAHPAANLAADTVGIPVGNAAANAVVKIAANPEGGTWQNGAEQF